MAQKRYYYDEVTCTYKQEVLTTKTVLKRTAIVIGAGLVFGGLFFAGFYSYWDDIKTKNLKEQNAALITKIDVINENLKNLEATVDNLHTRDNDFYRSMLNAQQVDNGVWEAGKGGANNPEEANQPMELKEAADKLDKLSYKIELQNRSYDYLTKLLSENKEKLSHIPAVKPVPGIVISGFGVRHHPILKIRKEHTGLDFTAPIGTPAMATADGEIITAGHSSGGYGNQIEIDHGFGFVTKFAHLSEIKVQVGQKVKRGDIIGLTGNTGLSSGPHLHYEIIKNGEKIDPVDYFYQDLSPKEYEQFRKEAQAATQAMD
ncbi:MAG: M23 family metallopeptidase [Bacteroidia bacterium]|nr:M23 family metallopeptidase [Bacteroidia bacterium]